MRRPPMRISGPTIGTTDPIALAGFYARMLGWQITDESRAGVDGAQEDWARIRPPAGGQKMEFQYEPYFIPPVWPPIAGAARMARPTCGTFGVIELAIHRETCTIFAC